MAMIKCPECSTDISDTAYDCPNCAATIRKPTRSFFGKIVKWLFIIFNLLMVVWLIAGFGLGSDGVQNASSDAEAAGAAIGAGLGLFLITIIWVLGDIILGLFFLFTRPSK